MNKKALKVFIIDDSRLMRSSIRSMLESYKDIDIIGEAPNPVDAFEVFAKVGLPDLFILDVEMPKMDGITFLKQIREQRPVPTIIFSSVVSKGSANTVRALALGACDVISKPRSREAYESPDYIEEFVDKVRACANSKFVSVETTAQSKLGTPLKPTTRIVGIGASTGGVQALTSTLPFLRPNHAPIVITQHMPTGFTASFAKQLNDACKYSHVKEAADGDSLLHGQILIAPGSLHLEVKRISSNRFKAQLKDYPKVSSHKPSVDVLFSSLAKEARGDSVGIILTGMGKDGALGLKKIRDAGGKTFGQDEETCVVYGMPKVAFDLGAVEHQLPINRIADKINSLK